MLILQTEEKCNIRNLKKYISNTDFTYVKDLLKTSDLKKSITKN